MARPAVALRALGKRYRRAAGGYRLRTLKSALLERSLTSGLAASDAVEALADVSFEVAAGEAVGIIGGNGSGKSTLIKLVAGLLRPSAGELTVNGSVAALIELGAGFHPEISGRENVFINGALLGLSRRQIEDRYDDIVEFAGLGDFIEEPIKNYSSGMYVRLGFSVAIHTDPEILLVDEVLAVGDEEFVHRCIARIEEHLSEGGTLLVVSHSMGLIDELCDRAVWLDQGRLRAIGSTRRVIDAYFEAVAAREGEAHERRQALAAEGSESRTEEEETAPEAEEEILRWGSGQARIVAARLLAGAACEERYHLHCGEAAVFELEVEPREELDDFVFGVGVKTPRGVDCWGTNTDLAGYEPRRLRGPVRVRLACPELRLAPGEYTVDLAVHARDGRAYDYRRRALRFTVAESSALRSIGLYLPDHEWHVEALGGGAGDGAADRQPAIDWRSPDHSESAPPLRGGARNAGRKAGAPSDSRRME
ncbi:MAG: ABC transporter ATP-binding protein [Acidobacteria bacterium]|nr:ABC transporter ATP-binding protein [Acidobacteriota bacterium]